MKKAWLAAGCLGVLLGVGMPMSGAAADAKKGKAVFDENCSMCHESASTEVKVGPGLKGLFKKEKLKNGKKPSDAVVLAIINAGGGGMPAYGDQLSDEEKANVLAYLRTL